MFKTKKSQSKALGFFRFCAMSHDTQVVLFLLNKKYPEGHFLFLLLVDSVSLGDWVELLRFVLLAWVLLVLVIETSVVGMTLPNAVFVAL